MEKVIYLVWSDGDADLRAHLLDDLVPALLPLAAGRVQVNVVDEAVAAGVGLRQVSSVGPIDGFVSIWLATAIDQRRAEVDALVAGTAGVARSAAYLVAESEPLHDPGHPPRDDGRSEGFTQVVCLRRPERLSPADWFDRWLGHHTQVAIDTQSTVRYVQNQVVRPLTTGAPVIAGIVEETFPVAALDQPAVFFDADDDRELLGRNITAMVESVSSFLDLDDLDVVPTSEYRFG